jgi:hypothetical protein
VVEAVGVRVPLTDRVVVGVPLDVAESDCVDVAVAVSDGVVDAVGVRVPLTDRVVDGVPLDVAESDCVDVAVAVMVAD